MIIIIDFDGTCVTHEFPNVGKDIGAVPVLRELVKKGHKLILFTMRSGKYLEDAIEWFRASNVPLWGINENPEQHTWTSSPKPYGHIMIDDSALGCPTRQWGIDRPYVDWYRVAETLEQGGFFGKDFTEEDSCKLMEDIEYWDET